MKKLLLFLLLALPGIATAQAQYRIAQRSAPNPVTTFDTTGIVGTSTAADTAVTVTIPGGTWADGQVLQIRVLVDDSGGSTMAGTEYLRAQITVTGCPVFTMDSSNTWQTVHVQTPLTLEFQRVGNDIWYCPATWQMSGNTQPVLTGASKNNISGISASMFQYLSGNSNGAILTGANFANPITIRWINQFTTGHGDATSQFRMRGAGALFMPLN